MLADLAAVDPQRPDRPPVGGEPQLQPVGDDGGGRHRIGADVLETHLAGGVGPGQRPARPGHEGAPEARPEVQHELGLHAARRISPELVGRHRAQHVHRVADDVDEPGVGEGRHPGLGGDGVARVLESPGPVSAIAGLDQAHRDLLGVDRERGLLCGEAGDPRLLHPGRQHHRIDPLGIGPFVRRGVPDHEHADGADELRQQAGSGVGEAAQQHRAVEMRRGQEPSRGAVV